MIGGVGVNPIITAALLALGAKLEAKHFSILIGVNGKAPVIVGGKVGAAGGGELGMMLDFTRITYQGRP